VIGAALVLLAVVAFVERAWLYTSVAAAGSSPWVRPFIAVVAELGVLVLVATAALLAAWAWLRDRRAFLTLAAAGTGVVGAYGTSELVKTLVEEERPCRVFDVATALACPAVGDWSWPSNHATIAGALATACGLVAPRTVWLVGPVAAAVAASRVAAGVHYVHDVLAGAALGIVGVLVALRLLRPLRDVLVVAVTRRG